MIRIVFLSLTLVALPWYAFGDDKVGPDDPFASISGEPIFLGELNLILVERLRIRDLDRVAPEVQQATALMLVRQHLALRSLRKQAGPSLDSLIDRQIESFASDAKRRGSSLEDYAKKRKSTERSLHTT